MASEKIVGKNFSFEDDNIEVFGVRGKKIGRNNGAINTHDRGWFKVVPAPIIRLINDCIDAAIRAGDGDKITQLRLGAYQAVVLYLTGALTRQHFSEAKERGALVMIPRVKIRDLTLSVRISASDIYDISVADAKGNVL